MKLVNFDTLHYLFTNKFLNDSNRDRAILGLLLPTILNSEIPVSELVPFNAHDPFFIKYGCGFFMVTFFLALTSYASILDIN